MQSNLTTADIAACAARFLADTRGLADRQHAAALAMPGSADALQCARRIDVWLSDCDAAWLLKHMASFHGDEAAAEAIAKNISATTARLISQASEARRASMAQAA